MFKKISTKEILKKARYALLEGAARTAGSKAVSHLLNKALPKRIKAKIDPETIGAIAQNVLEDLDILGSGVKKISKKKEGYFKLFKAVFKGIFNFF